MAKQINWGKDIITFPKGTIGRNNRTDEIYSLRKPQKGVMEDRKGNTYRLEHGDWVYKRDNSSGEK